MQVVKGLVREGTTICCTIHGVSSFWAHHDAAARAMMLSPRALRGGRHPHRSPFAHPPPPGTPGPAAPETAPAPAAAALASCAGCAPRRACTALSHHASRGGAPPALQPSSFCYGLFDRVMVLTAGRVLYFGDAKGEAIAHFTGLCGARQPQVGDNLAEWTLDLTTMADREGRAGEMADKYAGSGLCQVGRGPGRGAAGCRSQPGTARHSIQQYSRDEHSTVQHGTAHHSIAQRSTAKHSAQRGTTPRAPLQPRAAKSSSGDVRELEQRRQAPMLTLAGARRCDKLPSCPCRSATAPRCRRSSRPRGPAARWSEAPAASLTAARAASCQLPSPATTRTSRPPGIRSRCCCR
jgi:hypothetical protein